MTPTIYAHLDDCQNCEHIRFQHDGKCMIRDCHCEGFEKKCDVRHPSGVCYK